jgi:hypothetical protein
VSDDKAMLILRGNAGTFDGKEWPKGALYEAPALAYAARRGYVGQVLDVAGWTPPRSYSQINATLEAFRVRPNVSALYGFSGGGYNIAHVLAALSATEKAFINLVVVLGAPNNTPRLYQGPWELVYRVDPPAGHMAGPQALLEETT